MWPELEPLRATLPVESPSLPDERAEQEIGVIDTLTPPGLFRFNVPQLQDGRTFLVRNDRARLAEAGPPGEMAPGGEAEPAATDGETGTQ